MTFRSRGRLVRGGILVVAALAILIPIGFAVGAADAIAGEPTIVVTANDGTELVAAPLDDDTEVILEYTHSVEKTLVRDVYVAEGDTLVMTRMEFSSFGAGLPAQAEVTERNGRYVYQPPPGEYSTLHLKTGPVADHDLIVGGERYDIAALSGYGAVELTVEHRATTLL